MGALTDRTADLEAEYTANKGALARMLAAGQSSGVEGVTTNRVQYAALRARQSQIIRSLQRLGGGGRLVTIDVSVATQGGDIQTSDGTGGI